jgi:hypothetical protein
MRSAEAFNHAVEVACEAAERYVVECNKHVVAVLENAQ